VPDLDPGYVASFTASVTNGSATITASANVTSEIEAGSLINIAGYSYIVSSIAGDNVTVTLESDVLSATGAGQEVKIYMGTGAAITVAAADTVDLSKDSSIITSNGGTGSFTTEITVGSLVSIGGVIYTVRQVDSDDQFRVTVPAPAAATGATMTILRGIPFPMAR
jgi:riboflavin synthase alpha subunit